jgi:hypothetical protein
MQAELPIRPVAPLVGDPHGSCDRKRRRARRSRRRGSSRRRARIPLVPARTVAADRTVVNGWQARMERDPDLPNKLRAGRPGILAWAIRGYRDDLLGRDRFGSAISTNFGVHLREASKRLH